jgi:hypothetical protein
MTARKGWFTAAGTALLAAVIALAAFAWPPKEAAKQPLGLFTSLPIYWNEQASVAEALDGAADRHWVRAYLENRYRLVPLDTLDGSELAGLHELVMAQPRPLAAQENVALDSWVREGGRLLLFADPFLTEESRFALGDKRRPQDVVLLSPILSRWGLQLTFDDEQSDAERLASYRSTAMPERLAGRLRLAKPSAPAHCGLFANGLVSECAIGEGRVVIVADAAILEADRSPGDAEAALSVLLESAFGR